MSLTSNNHEKANHPGRPAGEYGGDHNEIIRKIHEQFVIPVVRAPSWQLGIKAVEVLAEAGLRVCEITLTTPNAAQVFQEFKSRSDVLLGAGTVLNVDQAKLCLDSHAQFLVSPGLDLATLKFMNDFREAPFFPGVLTPSEVQMAKNHGCTKVKLFPAGSLGGIKYLKALKGPFPDMEFFATGGIGSSDIDDYRRLGALAIGAGSELISTNLIAKELWNEIRENASRFARKI